MKKIGMTPQINSRLNDYLVHKNGAVGQNMNSGLSGGISGRLSGSGSGGGSPRSQMIEQPGGQQQTMGNIYPFSQMMPQHSREDGSEGFSEEKRHVPNQEQSSDSSNQMVS